MASRAGLIALVILFACLWRDAPGRARSRDVASPLLSDPRGLVASPDPEARLYLLTAQGLFARPLGGQEGGYWRLLGRPGSSRASDGSEPESDPPSQAASLSGSSRRSRQVALAAQGRRVVISAGIGVEEWVDLGAGLLRRRHALMGLPVVALAADADGQRIFATQGRWLWVGRAGRWERGAVGPGLPWRHLAAHPYRPGWLLGTDGREVYRSRDAGRSWETVGRGSASGIREARFTACPRRAAAPLPGPKRVGRRLRPRSREARRASEARGVIARSQAAFWRAVRGSPGAAHGFAPRALLEAHPEDPAVYVLGDRLYRWPCRGGEPPRPLGVRVDDVVAMARDPRRADRLWLVGASGLRVYAAGSRPAASGPGEGGRAASGNPLGRGPTGRLARARWACRGEPRLETARHRARAAARWPGPRRPSRAAFVPSVTLRAEGVLADKEARRRGLGLGLGGRLAHRFGLYVTLGWPLEAPAAALYARETAAARARKADPERDLAGAFDACVARGADPLRQWEAGRVRAAVDRYHRREEATERASNPGRGGTP